MSIGTEHMLWQCSTSVTEELLCKYLPS